MPSMVDRAKSFIKNLGFKGDSDYTEDFFMNSPYIRGYQNIFSETALLLRDIPLMLKDPIVNGALALQMESAFQINMDQTLFKVNCDYPIIKKELEDFHAEFRMDDYILLIAYNLLLYGNLPIKIEFDDELKFKRFMIIPDFRKVTPIVVSNKVIGYQYENNFYEPFEFVYGQYLYYKDIGVHRGLFTYGAGDRKMFNEFVYAPSYLSPALRSWRSIRLIEDALLLMRLDQANYMRIISVNVGDNVFSKNAIKLLNFYRSIFKKVRRISYEQDGMSSTSFGNEFEVILPETAQQKVTINDVGGQCLRYNTKVRLLSGEDVEIGYMYENKEKFVGKGVFTCDKDGEVGVSPITNLSSLRKNTNFVRVWLDNNESFDVTPDHPCQMRTGEFREAQYLKEGDSLMPLVKTENCKVVRVEWLDVIEDSYDLTVESKDHCFALSCGVFVHNTDVKALKDLDMQFKRLFASLRLRPEYLGFETSSMNSLGESPITKFDERFARTTKTLVYSTSRVLKELDLIYLRSKGYDVTRDDWSYSFVSTTTVEDEEKRLSQKLCMETIKTMVENLDGVGIMYNKKYLVKSLLEQFFTGSSLDISVLLNEQEEKRPIISSDSDTKSALFEDRFSTFNTWKELGFIGEDEYNKQYESYKSSCQMIISSKKLSPINYTTFISNIDLYSNEKYRVDIRGQVRYHKGIDVSMYKKNNSNAALPTSVVCSNKKMLLSKELSNGTVANIENVYILSDGTYYMEKDDLVNYLTIIDNGYKHFVAKNVYVLKQGKNRGV